MKAIQCILFCFILSTMCVWADGFTQSDRERTIRTEVTLQEFMKSTDRRFEQIDKRFEQVDKRFEQVDKRFEDFNTRFQEMMNLLIAMISVFAAAMGGCFVYVLWDRRTFLKTSLKDAQSMMDDKIAALQKEGKLTELIKAMRELAKEDAKVKTVLSKYHLL